jgi:hypothetical protein
LPAWKAWALNGWTAVLMMDMARFSMAGCGGCRIRFGQGAFCGYRKRCSN